MLLLIYLECYETAQHCVIRAWFEHFYEEGVDSDWKVTKRFRLAFISDGQWLRWCMNGGHEDNEAVPRFSGKECPDSSVMPAIDKALEITARNVACPCHL